MRKGFLFAGAMSFFLVTGSVAARNPTGEIANYSLDKRQSRTSSIIRKGTLKFEVGAFKPKPGTKGVYPSKLIYDITALFAGHLQGEKILDTPSEFFDPKTMERLRKEGTLDQKVFKLKYLGKQDVETMGGIKYPACDKIRAYDVKLDKIPALEALVLETFGRALAAQELEHFQDLNGADIENIEFVMYITRSVPVLGAAKLDASAKIKGFFVKAGFDYVLPDPDEGPRI